jgi:hypothetical protein
MQDPARRRGDLFHASTCKATDQNLLTTTTGATPPTVFIFVCGTVTMQTVMSELVP